uniref:2,3-bisphosphoglycerate-independent phosphoglycerate mutase n=1 Tax=Caloglossa intermedia TaxID=100879 RepID=A0A1Z1M5P3_9FLOR|nr:phosphoglycerate mutase [Caloglossa intermedia]ARW61397.1 phosphoglycerate mutase [Caloglossa intermedia]
MNNKPISPVVLAILDGWGHSEKTQGNAIKLSNTPTMDKLWTSFPHSLLSASGKDVGLPDKQVGNSEVGHATIGAGRIIDQNLVRIQRSINNQEFFKNETIHNLCQQVCNNKSRLHIIGLCSDGGVHSHINHLKALLEITKQYDEEICLHLITDGRDTAPRNAAIFVKDIIKQIKNMSNTKICTISGRYYSMDRDCRWNRTEKTYKILTENSNITDCSDCIEIIKNYYSQNISDEFIPPTRINNGKISDNDGILFFNFRPDRTRQILQCIAKENFKGFAIKKIHNLKIVTFTKYDTLINTPVIFPDIHQTNFLGQIISSKGFKQLRIAETEKYAHVTYFFNGGIEEPFPGEDRQLVPSPKVETYDLKPEMSAYQLTENLIQAIDRQEYKLIVINYANTDMVGHTGNLIATIKAVEIIDQCITQIYQKIQEVNGKLIITADHGNADYMLDENNKPCKSHSINFVPFILIQDGLKKSVSKIRPHGCLADIAPTILDILEINIPKEMNGQSLLKLEEVSLQDTNSVKYMK